METGGGERQRELLKEKVARVFNLAQTTYFPSLILGTSQTILGKSSKYNSAGGSPEPGTFGSNSGSLEKVEATETRVFSWEMSSGLIWGDVPSPGYDAVSVGYVLSSVSVFSSRSALPAPANGKQRFARVGTALALRPAPRQSARQRWRGALPQPLCVCARVCLFVCVGQISGYQGSWLLVTGPYHVAISQDALGTRPARGVLSRPHAHLGGTVPGLGLAGSVLRAGRAAFKARGWG